MKEIPLSQGKVALVDDADFEDVSRWKWTATQNSLRGEEKWYAYRNIYLPCGARRKLYLHRYLMKTPEGMVVDHYPDRNGLNCQRHNMTNRTQDENMAHCRFKKK